MKYNISISVDNKFSEMIEQIKEESEIKGQSFSFTILDAIQKSRNKLKSLDINLNSTFEEIQKYGQQVKIEELKQISHKANVIMLTLEALIKYESYEGTRKHNFHNARDAERYLRS